MTILIFDAKDDGHHQATEVLQIDNIEVIVLFEDFLVLFIKPFEESLVRFTVLLGHIQFIVLIVKVL